MKTLLVVPLALAALAASRTSDAPAPTPPPDTWSVDNVHTSVLFRVKHVNTSHFYGMFKKVSGEFTFDAAKPESCKVELTIATDSVDTRDADRDKHLRNTDFFDAKQFPEIKFTSSKIAKNGDAFDVTGELAMHGKKVALTIPVTKTGEGEMQGKRLGLETKFTIKRGDFGLAPKVGANMLSEEVELTIAIEGVQKK